MVRGIGGRLASASDLSGGVGVADVRLALRLDNSLVLLVGRGGREDAVCVDVFVAFRDNEALRVGNQFLAVLSGAEPRFDRSLNGSRMVDPEYVDPFSLKGCRDLAVSVEDRLNATGRYGSFWSRMDRVIL